MKDIIAGLIIGATIICAVGLWLQRFSG